MAERRDGLARARVEAGHTQETLADAMGVDWRTIRRWEAGTANPQPYRRVKLAKVLRCDLKQLNSLLDRHGFIAEASGSEQGSRVRDFDSPLVNSVRSTAQHLIGLDMQLGAHDIADVAIRSAVVASHKLTLPDLSPKIEKDLTSAVAEVFEVAGWITFDAERQVESEKLNRKSLLLSALAGDADMEKLAKLNMSMQSTHVGRYGEAVDIAQSIIDSAASARVHAMCLIRQARAFSKAENCHAITMFDQAASLFQDGISVHDPGWAWWIDQYEFDGQFACALLDLGQGERAAGILWDIVESIDDSAQPMYRTIWLMRLLEALVSIERWAEVETLLVSIESKVDGIGSTRALNVLASIASNIPDKAPSAVQDAAHAIGTTLKRR